MQVYISGHKMLKGKIKLFSKKIWGGAGGEPFTADMPPNPILVRLTEKGRSYIPAVKLEGIEGSKWIEHDKFTVLRVRTTASGRTILEGWGDMGGTHEWYADIWSATLHTAASIRTSVPQAKHEALLHKLQRHVQTRLDGSAGR